MNVVEVKRGKTHAYRFSPDWLRKGCEILSELKSAAMNSCTNHKTDSSSRSRSPFSDTPRPFVERPRVFVTPARKCDHFAVHFHALVDKNALVVLRR